MRGIMFKRVLYFYRYASTFSSMSSSEQRGRLQPVDRSERLSLLADQIVNLSMMDASELSKILAERLNIPSTQLFSTASSVSVNASTVDDGEESEDGPKEQKTSFTLHLRRFEGDKKVALIKEVKQIVPDLNLVQAKKFVESLPHILRDNIGKEEAEQIVKRLEPLGAVCSIE